MSITPYVRKAVASVFLASLALSLTPAVVHADSVTEKTPSPSSLPSPSAFSFPNGEQRYIVQYNNNVDAEAESESLKQKGIEVKGTLSHSIKASVVVATPTEIETLKASADVATVELDQPVSMTGATSIWGLDRIDQRTGRDGQYYIGDEGSGVNVYVVDSGLYPGHSQFEGRVPTGWTGINDGRGTNDCNGHGTHVAGTIAGTTYGVAKKANIIPIRALDCNGNGWSSTVIAGIDWTIAHHTAGQPAVMNMSIGGFTSASLDQSVRKVINDGITVVAAAGNSGQDACNSAPASVTPAITVAATDINDSQASWSNYGSCVDVQAPGVSIRSAWNNAPTGYNTLDGTSMAAPHVAGAAAIMLSRNRSLTPSQVHQSIINNSTTGVVKANKGATPNRLLFIPAYVPTPVSCANLQFGDAWAGVGTHCGLQGASAAATSVESAENTPTTVTNIEAVDTPVSASSAATVQSPVAPVAATTIEVSAQSTAATQVIVSQVNGWATPTPVTDIAPAQISPNTIEVAAVEPARSYNALDSGNLDDLLYLEVETGDVTRISFGVSWTILFSILLLAFGVFATSLLIRKATPIIRGKV